MVRRRGSFSSTLPISLPYHTHKHTHTHTHTRTHTYTHTHTKTPAHTHAHTYTHIHKHMHIHIYTETTHRYTRKCFFNAHGHEGEHNEGAYTSLSIHDHAWKTRTRKHRRYKKTSTCDRQTRQRQFCRRRRLQPNQTFKPSDLTKRAVDQKSPRERS